METLGKIKRALSRAVRFTSRKKQLGVHIVGYYNGNCPLCDTHIGTDIYEDKLAQKFHATCGACGQEIFDKLDKEKIVMRAVNNATL